ncbi:MAG: metallophosphoesterase [Promethearchaeota archaeon]
MKIEKKIINIEVVLPDEYDELIIAPIGDIHYGARNCDVELFEYILKWCEESENVMVFLMGDLIEASNIHSVGMEDQILDVNDQVNYIISKFQKLAREKKIIGVVQGNHEKRILKHANYDITKMIAEILDIPYARKGTFIQVKVRNESQKKSQIYVLYAIHGGSGSYTVGGKINAVMRLQKAVEAEVYMMGHVHELLHVKIPRETVDRGRVKQLMTHFVLTGGFLKYWGSYAQERGYAPTSRGSPKIKLHIKEHRVSVSC